MALWKGMKKDPDKITSMSSLSPKRNQQVHKPPAEGTVEMLFTTLGWFIFASARQGDMTTGPAFQELERQYSPNGEKLDVYMPTNGPSQGRGPSEEKGGLCNPISFPLSRASSVPISPIAPPLDGPVHAYSAIQYGFPIVIYIHGGYWQFLSKEESGFMAVPLVQRGVAVAAVGYDIAPKGNMDLIVSQVRSSIVSIVQKYSHTSGVYLCGHSAGAHLAAMVLCTDWSQYSITPQIKGAFLVSGIYDLLPILSTYVNEPLKMTEDVALRNSPGQLVPQLKRSSSACHIVVAVAQNDSPEFRCQSENFFKDLESMGLTVTFADVPDTDHFNVIERFVDEDYQLTQLLLKIMEKN
ncbi:hypothetical protein JZ751_027554 [Albula glossodonta]|uniref:BD-FAE-like domain-containing protein n=1 Tax=Albula glossodonta TaxID=121402 RepID=A0A8T2NG40_9TELE|nr:hypothetical protein JZ751_027554 [Albula glossodonta]